MKKNMLTLTMLSLLAMTVAGCGNKTNSNSNNNSEDSNPPVAWPEEQQEDIYGVLPEDVKNANVSIDLLVYIEGQNGRLPDIGNFSNDESVKGYRYYPKDVSSIEMAKYFGAANAFKKLCPGVQINLAFCNIADYPGAVRQYKEGNGHLPHLMWGTDHCVQMLSYGYNYDLSHYSDSAYYDQYNDYLMTRFNYGGFQAAFPISSEPWGILTNASDLVKYNLVSSVLDSDTSLPSSDYKNYVSDFTWERFTNSITQATDIDNHHAGISKVVEWFVDYSLPTIYEQFIRTGTVDLTSPETTEKITRLLTYENNIATQKQTVYKYGLVDGGAPQTGSNPDTDTYPSAAAWNGRDNCVLDNYCTLWGEAPWAIGTVSSRISTINEEAANGEIDSDTGQPISEITDKFDVLPFPKYDSSSTAYTGIAVEGMTVGNQCPIGTECTAEKQLEMDVAAYFTMFMGLDPRSIESRSNIHYIFNGEDYYGDATFPLSKHGSRFAWQIDGTLSENDPASAYEDNWQYQMANYFKVYNAYVTDGKEADVVTFRNIMPGITAVLDSVYAIPGIGLDDYVTCLNYYNEPVDIADDTGQSTTGQYVSKVLSNLQDLETDINTHSIEAWAYLEECVDAYYGEGLYNMVEKNDDGTLTVLNQNRNSYQGYKE